MTLRIGTARPDLPGSPQEPHYQLTLFVSGASSSSARAIRDVTVICERHLEGRYDLSVVDVNQDPELARGSRVQATPTLLKVAPAPESLLVGDLSDDDRVLTALGVPLARPVIAGAG